MDTYRNAVYSGSKTPVAPNPDSACAANFRNTDTELGIVNYCGMEGDRVLRAPLHPS